MSRERWNYQILLHHAGTGPDRTERLESLLAEERAALRSAAADTWEHHVITSNVEALETALASSRRNDAAGRELDAEIAAQRQLEAARQEERRAALAEAEVAALRSQYKASNPAATDAEIDAAMPALVERHRRDRMQRIMDQARAAYRI